MEAKISVIIPIYKVEPFLRECLNSIVNQTYRNLEIILIDDGSPDNCGHICDEYASADERIIVIHKKNGGLCAARNDGLARATGEWISFVDSDDWCEPTLYERAEKEGNRTEADIVMFSLFQNSKSDEERIHAFSKNFTTDDPELIMQLQLSVLDKHYIPFTDDYRWGQGFPWDKLFKRSLIENHHLCFSENVRANEDIIFNIHAFQFAKKVTFFDEALYHWRMNEGSIGHKYMPDRAEVNREIYREMMEIGHKYNLQEEYYRAVNARTVNNMLDLGHQCYFNPQREGSLLQNLYQLQKEMDQEPYATVWKEVDGKMLGKTGKVLKYIGPMRALGLYIFTKKRQMKKMSYFDAFENMRGGVIDSPNLLKQERCIVIRHNNIQAFLGAC